MSAVASPLRELARLVALVAACTVGVGVGTDAVAGVSYLVLCLAACIGIVRGLLRHRPSPALPWLLLAAAPLLGAVGMTTRLLPVAPGDRLLALLPDLVTIPAYLLIVAGLSAMVLARRGAGLGSALDCGLMGLAALLLSWALLIRPLLLGTDLPLEVKVLNGLYPALSVMVLSLTALLAMTTEVARNRAAWALGGAVTALLTGDVVYAVSAAAGDPTQVVVTANVAYCVAFGLLGIAGLDPSMARLVQPTPSRVRGFGHGRFAAVAVALVVPVFVVLIRPVGSVGERVTLAGVLGLVAILVLVRTASAVNSTVASERRLEEQALRDALTGLPNRFQLTQHLAAVLESARVQSRGVAVLFMDLDQFKAVNDTWGHQTGDELLVVMGSRLTARVRAGELVARVGGDEFVVVAEDVDGPEAASALARRLLGAFDARVELTATTVSVDTSIGVALAPAGAAASVEELLRDADTAMYRAKTVRGGSFEIFDESMRVELAERLSLEADLREALGRGEIGLHYQPIVDLQTGETKGFEALMRWTHPVRGAVRPDVFIPVAEDTGIVMELGRWAIEEAGARLREWCLEFAGPLSMSVNLSPRQMLDPELVPTVARVLDGLPVAPSSLALEITETSLIDDAGSTADTIAALKALGVRLSADDFGTGYSSLAYLRRYPFDQVKVDRSFVAGLEAGGDDEVIVAAVLSMARALSLTTVAEGVETDYQRDRLREFGAHSGQGWLFARPMPADQARAHLASGRRRVVAA